jgi:hypothetical protein
MGFLGISRPFQKETTSNYPGVLISLSEAKRHDTVEADYARRRSEEASWSEDSGVSRVAKSDEEGTKTPRSVIWHAYTVESLRAEVNGDVAASGHDSAYDCEFCFHFQKREERGWRHGRKVC